METIKEPEIKRKRGRPPLNKSINGDATKYHFKALQQPIAPKEAITPTEPQSHNIGAIENGAKVVVLPTPVNLTPIIGGDEVVNPKEVQQIPVADSTPVDSIEFVNGKNTLTVVLSKKHNRMYRVQVFLNNTMEIRPATYTGYSPASTFWGFLKEITKQSTTPP